MNEHLPVNYLGRKFTTLRVFAALLKIVGILIGLVPIFITVLTFSTNGFGFPGSGWGSLTVIISLVYGLGMALGFFALSEVILVLLSMEENTRRAAFYGYQTSATARQNGAAALAPVSLPDPVGLEELAQHLQGLTNQVTTLNEVVSTMATHAAASTETMKAIAESSRATALLLHRQQGK